MKTATPTRHALGRGLLALAYGVLVTGPLLALAIELLRMPPTEGLRTLLATDRRLALWWRSVVLAAAVSAGSMAIGTLAALQLDRWRGGLRAVLRWFFLLLIPFPPMTHAMAWSWLSNQLNRTLGRTGLGPFLLRGWPAAWWVQVMWLAPLATGLALVALASVDPILIEAGQLHQRDDRVLARLILPLMMPLLLAGGGLTFLLSLVDYAIPSLYQLNVYALDIFADFSVHHQPGRTLIVALPLLVTTIGTILFSQARLRPAALNPTRFRQRPILPDHEPTDSIETTLLLILQQGAVALLGLGAAIPLAGLILQLSNRQHLRATLLAARGDIGYTLRVALLAGVLSLPLGYTAARAALHARRGRRLGWLAITLPLAVPGPLVGIGLIAIWTRLLPLGIYGSALMPVLAAVARYTGLAALVLVASLRRINPTLIEVATLLQPSRLRTWLCVRLPMLAPGMVAAAAVVSCLTLGELSATLLVAAPGQATLTMRIYNFLHYGASDTVAGLTLVPTALVLAFGALAVGALAIWAHLTRRPHTLNPESETL
jgi:iron(III) transport system permease protein